MNLSTFVQERKTPPLFAAPICIEEGASGDFIGLKLLCSPVETEPTVKLLTLEKESLSCSSAVIRTKQSEVKTILVILNSLFSQPKRP